jgi:hypothetical protein
VTGVQYITDEKGRKVAVQIDLRRHKALWEDFQDTLITRSRGKEKGIPGSPPKREPGTDHPLPTS